MKFQRPAMFTMAVSISMVVTNAPFHCCKLQRVVGL